MDLSTEGESDAATANDDNSPGLYNMIDALKGGSGIQELTNLIETFKVASEGLSKYIAASPLMKQMVDEAAKRNPKLEIMLKVMIGGEIPDLHDLYKLATTKSNSITADIQAVQSKSAEWKKFSQLIGSKNVLTSKQGAEELVNLLTGKKVDLKQSLLSRMSRNRFKLRPVDDVAHVDLLQSMYFLVNNWIPIVHIVNKFGEGKTQFVDTIKAFRQLDYSHLMKVVEFPKSFNGGKYGVGSKDSKTDSDVVQMMKDLKTGQKLDAKDPQAENIAEGAVLDYIKRFLSITTKAMQWVESEGSRPGMPKSGETGNQQTFG